ncbi:FAD:protein FMN transferase [Actinokineospora sp. PR83]|uniref:FAD:protein FMN transferase n=1 Tax=Actinokineospora sp. PR83 TaxID=2884908 RepID=UPI0027DFA8BB|nr:FAD:protein FMN transferase [Actinokineospora sp. PR83]MCG8919941.1 FAD:protein FMN transferase [Actinokineospora sp. PR83]
MWGTTAVPVVTDPARLRTATALPRAHLAEVDLACSQFRPDSEVSRLYAAPGRAPVGGRQVAVGDDHRTAECAPRSRIALGGVVATSSTTRRAWRRAGGSVHHVIDPRTGRSAAVVRRTASVVAQSCVDANTVATAAIAADATTHALALRLR